MNTAVFQESLFHRNMIKRCDPVKIDFEVCDDTPPKDDSQFTVTSKSLLHVTKAIDFSAGLRKENSSDRLIMEEKNKKDLFFTVPDLNIKDLYDWSEHKAKAKPRFCAPPSGALVKCNDKKLAIFKAGERVFAIDESCPHMGGPLHVGDIESIGEANILCVVCPWHKWRIDLCTGKVKVPRDRGIRSNVYPVNVLRDGTIQVGFDKIFFNPDADF